MHRFVLSLLFCCAAASHGAHCHAGEAPSTTNRWGVGVSAGSLGLGVESSRLVYDTIVLRANATYLTFDPDPLLDSLDDNLGGSASYTFYAATAGLTVDLHPFQLGWRLSAGVRYIDLKLEEERTAGLISVGDHEYDASVLGGLKTGLSAANSVAPYLGVGYDSVHFTKDGVCFRIGFDLGVLYTGSLKAYMTPGTSNIPAELAADIKKEVSNIEDSVNQYTEFYPVAMLSARIGF